MWLWFRPIAANLMGCSAMTLLRARDSWWRAGMLLRMRDSWWRAAGGRPDDQSGLGPYDNRCELGCHAGRADAVQQQPDRLIPHLPILDLDGRERRVKERRDLAAAKPDHGHVVRDPQPAPVAGVQHADRHGVPVRHDGGWRLM